MLSQAILLAALAASASAHMTLNYPIPFAKANKAPLAPGDYPCNVKGQYTVDSMNQWNAGETKEVSFFGTATHGGGSCQFSITTDTNPTVDSQWKVIQSVVGGCPTNETGNLPEQPNPDDHNNPKNKLSATFPVTMPKDLPDGQYTFAWTWLNKVGNREFYMNCAPLQVGSGSGKASTTSAAKTLSALPNIFVANLPNTECHTTEGQDFEFPDPGQNVIRGKLATVGNSLTGAGCQKQEAMGAGNGQIGNPAPGSPAQSGSPAQPSASGKPAASAPASQAPQQSAAPANPGGVYAPGASSAPAAQPTTLVAQPKPSSQPAAPKNPPANPPANSNPDSNTTPSNGQCTPCTTDGAVVCIGTKQFGLCNRGCAVAQDLAAGMACTNGVMAASTKRHVHVPRGHLRRRFSNTHLI